MAIIRRSEYESQLERYKRDYPESRGREKVKALEDMKKRGVIRILEEIPNYPSED